MSDRVSRNKQFLTDLFMGWFPGHAIFMTPLAEEADDWSPGDMVVAQ